MLRRVGQSIRVISIQLVWKLVSSHTGVSLKWYGNEAWDGGQLLVNIGCYLQLDIVHFRSVGLLICVDDPHIEQFALRLVHSHAILLADIGLHVSGEHVEGSDDGLWHVVLQGCVVYLEHAHLLGIVLCDAGYLIGIAMLEEAIQRETQRRSWRLHTCTKE